MKINIVRIYFIFLCFPLFAQQKTQDAIIIYNNEERSYSISKLENLLYGTEITLKTSRRIKILSSFGLEQFATMYIPTFKDLDFKTEIISLKAQTIKASGSSYLVPGEAIRETTLPANVPFLRNYKGRVKAIAFENLEIGDEIQYDYEIKYTSSSISPDLYTSVKSIIPEEYKILESSYTFHLKNDIQFRGVVVNSDLNFKKGTQTDKRNSSYTLTMKDIEPYRPDEFSVEENNVPYFFADIYKLDDYTPYDKWDDFTKDIKVSKRDSKFFVGKSINYFYLESKKELTATGKILKIHDLMMSEMKKDAVNIYSIFKNYNPDLEDANQIFKLLKLLDINGGVLLVKNKESGTVLKDFVSLRQFDDLIIEFDDKGKTHYFALFDLYASIDEVNALYQGTEALKITVVDKKESVSFVKIPVLNTSKNTIKYDQVLHLKKAEGTVNFINSLHVEKNGQFFIEDRIGYMLEKTDKKFKAFTNEIKNDLKNSFPDCSVDTIILSQNNDLAGYQASFQYTLHSESPEYMFGIKLSDLFYSSLLMSDYAKRRTTTALFPYCYGITRKFLIKVEEGYTITQNLLLKENFDNEFAYINTDYKISAPDTMELAITYGIKQTELNPAKWSLFLSFIEAAQEALSQRILFQKG